MRTAEESIVRSVDDDGIVVDTLVLECAADHTDGDVNGNDFSGDGGELRRLRFGASVEFLDGFKIGARANLEKGGWRDDSIGYNGWDELYIEKEFDDVFGFDSGPDASC